MIPAWLNTEAKRLPVRPDNRGRTSARLYDAKQQPLTDPVLTIRDGSFRSGRVREAKEGLKPDWHRRSPAFDHAEAHAAAFLRKPDAPQSATLVVNNTPCVGSGRMVGEGCDDLLPGMLPPGKTLQVFATDGQRTWFHRDYRGTGEGIA